MSRPSQAKLTTTEHNNNGVSVIQSQTTTTTSVAGLQRVPKLLPSAVGVLKAPPPSSEMKKPSAEKDSDEYRQRRERNNLAVKKSRMRSKQKAMDTQQRVNELKEENERLEAKIKLLSKELSVLKDLFLEHAHNLADNVQPPAGNGNAGGSSPAHNPNDTSANGQ
ncbi:CCAAT/enhancer-binding protein gamma isoform X2 [Anarhichas minor]